MNKYSFIFKAIYFELKIKYIYLVLIKYYTIERKMLVALKKLGNFVNCNIWLFHFKRFPNPVLIDSNSESGEELKHSTSKQIGHVKYNYHLNRNQFRR